MTFNPESIDMNESDEYGLTYESLITHLRKAINMEALHSVDHDEGQWRFQLNIGGSFITLWARANEDSILFQKQKSVLIKVKRDQAQRKLLYVADAFGHVYDEGKLLAMGIDDFVEAIKQSNIPDWYGIDERWHVIDMHDIGDTMEFLYQSMPGIRNAYYLFPDED
jgi:hypothetical protein